MIQKKLAFPILAAALLTLFLFILAAPADVTDWTFPGTGTGGTPAGGTQSWTGPGNITADDGSDAQTGLTSSVTTEVLRASNFGFDLPDDVTINGIEARYERSASSSTTIQEATEQLIDANAAFKGDNKSNGTSWSVSDIVVTLGGDSDTWGTTWTGAEIEDSDFGFGIQATADGTAAARVDYVQIRIHYTINTPAAPTSCVAVQGDGDAASITWTDNATTEDNYTIERQIDGGGYSALSSSLAADTESYTDSALYPTVRDGSIQYRVKATKSTGQDSTYATCTAINYHAYTGTGQPVYYY